MACSGDNYRELLNGQGTLNLEPYLLSWKYNLTNLRNDMYTLKELIDIRDGINLYLYNTVLSVLFCVNKDIIII